MRFVNWRRVRVLVGETSREVGILVLVFAPLDAIIEGQATLQYFAALAGAAGACMIVVGIVVEAEE